MGGLFFVSMINLLIHGLGFCCAIVVLFCLISGMCLHLVISVHIDKLPNHSASVCVQNGANWCLIKWSLSGQVQPGSCYSNSFTLQQFTTLVDVWKLMATALSTITIVEAKTNLFISWWLGKCSIKISKQVFLFLMYTFLFSLVNSILGGNNSHSHYLHQPKLYSTLYFSDF